MSATANTASSADADAFSTLFVGAMLIIFSENFGQPASWYLAMAGLLFALLVPATSWRLSITSLVVIGHFLLDIDDKANHSNFAAILSVIVLIGLVSETRRGANAWPWMRLTIGWTLVGLYLVAAFHKVNRGFVDPEVSCSLLMLDKLASRGGVDADPSGWAWLLVGLVATAAWEIGAPIAMLSARWRWVGIAVAAAAHTALASIALHDFSAIAVACLALFLPADSWAGRKRLLSWLRFVYLGFGASAIVSSLIFGRVRYSLELAGSLLVILSALGVGYLGLRHRADRGTRLAARPKILVGLLLVVAFALLPYIGLRTGGVFNMFSNVRTELGESNHYLLPDITVFGHQDDVVEILETDLWWKGEPLEGMAWPVIEFEDFRLGVASWEEPAALTYRYRGVEYATTDLATEQPIGHVGWLERSVFEFRPIQLDGPPNRCRW